MSGPTDGWVQRRGLALLTDLYQLTMMAGHWKDQRTDQPVAFEYYFRNLPPQAGFAITAGLAPFLDYLENLRFEEDDVAYLDTLGIFDAGFLDFLRAFRPGCTVRAMPEGTLVYPYEPIVEVEGSLFEAQLLETALLNLLNYQTLIATKAARICLAADGEPVMEFGLRRAHGPDGGISGSRAAYIGGCSSSSNVLAGKVYGIPISGTHAHSWVMGFDSEIEAFRAFARHYPDRCTLLVDTYDTLESGVPNAIQVFRELHDAGQKIRPAIRLDSGDLAKLSKAAWQMMRDAGFEDPLIVASNDLEEDLIADLKRQGAKINAWGVGTHLITSHDCPAFNGVYKLASVYADGKWQPRIKISSNPEKATDPGRKQVYRYYNTDDEPIGDVMRLAGEDPHDTGRLEARPRTFTNRRVVLGEAARAEPLLQTVLAAGKRVAASPSIHAVRQRAQDQIHALPEEYTRLRNPEIYRVLLSDAAAELKEQLLNAPLGAQGCTHGRHERKPNLVSGGPALPPGLAVDCAHRIHLPVLRHPAVVHQAPVLRRRARW